MAFDPFMHRPLDLEEAINMIVLELDDEEQAYLIENGWELLHHSAGRALRNAWLWDAEHPLHQSLRDTYLIGHADDMSGLILEGVTCRIKKVEHDPHAQSKRYREHWIKNGIDPLKA